MYEIKKLTFGLLAGILVLSIALLYSCKKEKYDEKPNIIIILADDMGYGDVEVLNSESRIPTPRLNKLAEEGLIFTDAHSASYCVPSRYSLLTGRYLFRTRLGSGGNMSNFAGTIIEPGRMTIAEMLRQEGYYTGLVGKWHQGIDWKLHDESERDIIRDAANYQNFDNIDFTSQVVKGINDYGFDYSYAKANSAEMNPCTYLENDKVTSIPVYSSEEIRKKRGEWYGRDDNIIAEGFAMDDLVPTFSAKACEFIEKACTERPDKPFFLYYALTSPHNPVVPNEEFIGASKAGAYGDFVCELDYHTGKILDKLVELGIDDNTLVIFTSDNGPVDRTEGYYERWVRGDDKIYGHSSNGPFRGWKGSLWEGGHRIPFFIRWLGKIKAGDICSTTIIFNDIMPTLAEMLNIQLDDNTSEDGLSFFRALTGKERPDSFHEGIVHNTTSTRQPGAFAIRKGNYKLIVDGPKSNAQVLNDSTPVSFMLYDLKEDIKEINDISGKHPEKVKEMYELLKKYIREGRSNHKISNK